MLTAFTLALLATALTPPAPPPPSSPPTPAAPKSAAPTDAQARAARFSVRPGYRVSAAVSDLAGARFMEIADDGTLYVSRPRPGDIIALRDADGDGVYETRSIFLADRASVHAMDLHEGWLYFATTGSIHRARDTTGDGVADEIVDIIPTGELPRGGGHWWRSLLVTDDSIYTSIGDASNVSDQTKTDRQKIWRFDHDGGNKRLFASGLRNTEKLRLRPGTQEVWGIDHGTDWFGRPLGEDETRQPITDLNPPDELNHYIEGGFYGHPFLVGDRIPRYEHKDREDILDLAAQTIPPEWKIGSHWAVNGFTFIDPEVNNRTKALPPDHSGDLFAAAHGSWNSSRLVGYCIARILFDEHTGKPYGLLEVVTTYDTQTGEILARPVDCVQAPDGSVLFSCDFSGAVYRIEATATP